MAPFVAGQALQRWIGGFVQRHRKVLGMTDRGSVLLMVYTVFSAATVGGIWHLLTPGLFAILAAVDAALLALMLAATTLIARRLGFSRADEIAIVFCGSKKSLISGIAMANVMFAGPAVSLIVLPLMIFHQIQLMACAALARRYASAPAPASEPPGRGARTRDNGFGANTLHRRRESGALLVGAVAASRPQADSPSDFRPLRALILRGRGGHDFVTRVCVKLLTRGRGPRPNCRDP